MKKMLFMTLLALMAMAGSVCAAVPDYYTDCVTSSERYTGAIIDCRGLHLSRCMSPVIMNSRGTKLYGHKNLDREQINRYGMAGYVRSFHDPKLARAGDNPVVFKAIGTRSHGTYPVLDEEDGRLLEYSDSISHYMRRCAVVFVID